MPSTTSSSVSAVLASSTVMTPSLPTFCIASAIMAPTDSSPLAEIVPTWATSSEVLIFLAALPRAATTSVTARSMPRFRSIGFMPAATALWPSWTIDCARTVAVVVPSPAMSLVFEATSRTICAPMFSNLSSSSISLATVTPSLVMRGAPNDLSMTTLRPLGDGDAVLGDARCAERLVDDDVAAFGAERDLHCVGEDVDAAQHALAGVAGEFYVFSSHFLAPGRGLAIKPEIS
ncbi:hypothetical protein X770_24915 [Mesorhizobium sp. LSJC269B00]|nr:hypothetical protein X770_24915 [Mesorhizobium sp. LSJC269B00]